MHYGRYTNGYINTMHSPIHIYTSKLEGEISLVTSPSLPRLLPSPSTLAPNADLKQRQSKGQNYDHNRDNITLVIYQHILIILYTTNTILQLFYTLHIVYTHTIYTVLLYISYTILYTIPSCMRMTASISWFFSR